MWAILAIADATSAARIGGVLAYRRVALKRMTLEQARRWERTYSALAIAFTIGMALLTVRVFAAGWTNGEILAIGLTAGSCARTLRYWLCAALSRIALGALIAEREFDAAARRDPLTGLANRRAFDEALATSSGTGGFALLLLDLDGFKAVSDRLGHAAGDDLLRQVAGRLREATREQGSVARLGGEEFGIILPNTDSPNAKAMADRVIASIGLPYVVLGVPAIVGVSVGIELAGPGSIDGEALKREADWGLYAAKAAGKGQAVLATAA